MTWATRTIVFFVCAGILVLVAAFMPIVPFMQARSDALDNGESMQRSENTESLAIDYDEISVRPIFDRYRRPPITEESVQIVETPRPIPVAPAVEGVLARPDGTRVVYLRFPGQEQTMRVDVGSERDGWRVVDISASTVVLSYDGETIELPIDKPQ